MGSARCNQHDQTEDEAVEENHRREVKVEAASEYHKDKQSEAIKHQAAER